MLAIREQSSLGSFAEEVNLASVIECLDVFPTDNRDLRDPASEQVRTFNQGRSRVGRWGQVSALVMADAINSPNCSWGVSGLVLLGAAWSSDRGGSGIAARQSQLTGLAQPPIGRALMAAIRRLKVRGFMSPASTCSRSWDTQS